MNCPVCEGSRMREVEKEGILIDICPSCKGVWLDRGELDKLMQGVKEVREEYNEWYYGDSPRSSQPPQQSPSYRDNHDSHKHDSHKHSDYPPHKKKKKSVMDVFGDLFD
jgi:Zn-finger nucleic acid-binding protein